MDLEGGNQRLSSHTENVESQSIGILSECDMEDGAEDGNRGLMSNVAIDRIYGVYGALLK
jgi:hypothetical protein